jgi:uncharacterized membrane protein YozB (DUF420 family)
MNRFRGDQAQVVALLTLCIVPVLAGAARLTWLATGEARPDSARFDDAPALLVLHIVCASLFCVLGTLQITASIRHRWPNWHRSAGRVLAPTGLLAAISGLGLTVFCPPGPTDGGLLFGLRLFFGSAMALSLVLALGAICQRDFQRHGAWMIRAYAIAMGAGTQVIVFLPWTLLLGDADTLTRALLMGVAWLMNLTLAEWSLRRSSRRPISHCPQCLHPNLK